MTSHQFYRSRSFRVKHSVIFFWASSVFQINRFCYAIKNKMKNNSIEPFLIPIEFKNRFKMVLRILRKQMISYGILESDSTRSGEMPIVAKNCFFLGVFATFFVSTYWYVVSDAQEPIEYAKGFYFTITSATYLLAYSYMAWRRREFRDLIEDLDSIVQRSKRYSGRNCHQIIFIKYFLYSREQIEWIIKKYVHKNESKNWKRVSKCGFDIGQNRSHSRRIRPISIVNLQLSLLRALKWIIQTILSSFVSVFSSVMFVWFSYKIWWFPIFRYPFDWRTPYGFLACAFIQSISSIASVQASTCELILACGICLFIGTFVSDIKQRVHELNTGLKNVKNGQLTGLERMEKTKLLKDIIRFHSEAIEYVVLLSL